MRSPSFFAALAVVTVLVSSGMSTSVQAAEPTLSEQLEPLRPFVGKTYRGTFADSTPENPKIDIQRWERALNGQAIRIVHSINDGDYGGETLIVWDREQEKLVYYYFTTAGFYTHGTFTVEDGGKYSAHEHVTGNTNGITEVRSSGEVLPNGTLRGRSQYLKDGTWIDGHQIDYVEAPEAEVRFR